MDLQEVGKYGHGLDRVGSEIGDRWWKLVNVVMNLPVP
jgi:hypothetical protein